MIFLSLRFKNFFSFDNAYIDLGIKRKLVNSTIPDEYLEGYESFGFRKVCILSGANASGKTSIGKLLLSVQSFISSGRIYNIESFICDKSQPAELEVEYVYPNSTKPKLYRLRLLWEPIGDRKSIMPSAYYYDVNLRKSDTVYAARKRLDALEELNEKSNEHYFEEAYSRNLIERLRFDSENLDFGWYYHFESNIEDNLEYLPKITNKSYVEIILQTFDPSIERVSENRDEEGKVQSFTIIFKNKDQLVLDTQGDVTRRERLSKGTLNALSIAQLFDIMTQHRKSVMSAIYYVDEAMAYVHTELEQEILNLCIEHLPRHAQFFYTTHNYDILDLNLPVHSYVFINKSGQYSQIIQPEEKVKKNDRNLVNYLRNNAFDTIPDTSKLRELLYE